MARVSFAVIIMISSQHLCTAQQIKQSKGRSNSDATTTTEVERTRRLELMADVFGSYYAAHQHGGGYDAAKLYQSPRLNPSRHPPTEGVASNYGANLALPSYVDGGYRLAVARWECLYAGGGGEYVG